jgi:hypothetical protein
MWKVAIDDIRLVVMLDEDEDDGDDDIFDIMNRLSRCNLNINA